MSIVLSKRKLPAPGWVRGSGLRFGQLSSAADGLKEAAHVGIGRTQADESHDRAGEAAVDR